MSRVFYIPTRFELLAVFLDIAKKTSATKAGCLLTRALMVQRLQGDERGRGLPDLCTYLSLGLHAGLKYTKDKALIRRRLKGSMCQIDAECLEMSTAVQIHDIGESCPE